MECKCGEKREDMFYVSNKSNCKSCIRERVTKRRIENIEKVREYDRNRPNREERVIKNRDRIERYKTESPEKYKKYNDQKNDYRKRNKHILKAHNAVSKALMSGKIIRPVKCERCKNTNIEAHHPDYSKPLLVIWLCDKCHKEEHKRLREEERKAKNL